jgi:hypothetical protein
MGETTIRLRVVTPLSVRGLNNIESVDSPAIMINRDNGDFARRPRKERTNNNPGILLRV